MDRAVVRPVRGGRQIAGKGPAGRQTASWHRRPEGRPMGPRPGPEGRYMRPGPGHGQKEPPKRSDPLKVILVVAIALFIVILAFQVFFLMSDENKDGPTVMQLQEFMDGSTTAFVNSTYLGNDVYISVPAGSKVENAALTISGALPPQRMSFEAGKSPSCIDVGDLDGDLYEDLVVVNYADDTMMVLRNIGGGAFVKGAPIQVGKAPSEVVLEDLNGDGYLDAMVLSEDNMDMRTFMNDQLGGLRLRGDPLKFPSIPSDLVVLDLEPDGDMDAAVCTPTNNNVSILRNDGHGNLEPVSRISLEGGPTEAASGDVDGDGLTDLVVSNKRDRDAVVYSIDMDRDVRWYTTVSIYRNTGNGSFDRYVDDLRSDKGVTSIELADLNEDGVLDVAMANWGYKNVTLMLSDGSGDFERGGPEDLDITSIPSIDPIQIKLLDLDGDGDKDILSLTKSADSLLYYAGDGKGGFDRYTHYYVGMNPTHFDTIDADGDGDLDVVTSNFRGWDHESHGNGSVSLLMNLRSGIFGTYLQYRTGNSPRGVFVGDADMDGDNDIASANYFGSTISVLKNNGVGRFSSGKEYTIGLEPYAVVLADLDGDGNVDGASADEAKFLIVILRSDGQGGFTTDRYQYNIGAYPFSLRAKDIDGDGDTDLYTSNYFQNSTTIMFNDGSGNFSNMFNEMITVYLGGNMPYDALMDDINGDSLQDLITVNRGDNLAPTDTISVMLNDGTFEFTERTEYKVGKEPTSAMTCDLDNDGDIDIVTSNTGDDSLSILKNDGDGTFSAFKEIIIGDRPQFVNVLDWDDDGWMDLVSTNTDTNDLVIVRNDRGSDFDRIFSENIGSWPYAIDSKDVNGDGRSDVVITSVNTNNVVVTGCYYYPKDVRIDIGADGTYEHTYTGLLTEDDEVELDVTDAVADYVSSNPATEGNVKVPVRVIAGTEGIVVLMDLLVVYS